MLTKNNIINAFTNKIGKLPKPSQIKEYRTHTLEELNAILDRRMLIENNPSILNTVAEDYNNYLNASSADRQNWDFNIISKNYLTTVKKL